MGAQLLADCCIIGIKSRDLFEQLGSPVVETTATQGGGGLRKSLCGFLLTPFLGKGLTQPHLETEVFRIHVSHEMKDFYLLVLIVLLVVDLEKVFQLGKSLCFKSLVLVQFGQLLIGRKQLGIQPEDRFVNSYGFGCEIRLDIAVGDLLVICDRILFPAGASLDIGQPEDQPLVPGIYFHQVLEHLYRLIKVALRKVFLGKL